MYKKYSNPRPKPYKQHRKTQKKKKKKEKAPITTKNPQTPPTTTSPPQTPIPLVQRIYDLVISPNLNKRETNQIHQRLMATYILCYPDRNKDLSLNFATDAKSILMDDIYSFQF